MKLIIGLGNPWTQYTNTRHNAGFLFIDYFAKKNNFWDFSYESKFKADISSWIYEWEKTLLVKPQTFMNLSGESVQKIIHFYKLEQKDDIIVIYDDISMDFWKTRYRITGSAGWQNWVKDIIKKLSDEFKRIKIWIWLNKKYDVSDWVLSKFTADELIDLENEIFPKVSEILQEKI